MTKKTFSRRNFLKLTTAAGGVLVARSMIPEITGSRQAPAFVSAQNTRPQVPYGVASGDILADQAVVWSKTDRPARMIVEVATTESMSNARTVRGPAALVNSDFTAKLPLANLPADQEIFYRVTFDSLEEPGVMSEPVTGRFRTAPAAGRDINFMWSGDTVGQGWGINPEIGGMTIYSAMAALEPDFFIHSGDTIYADDPVREEVELADGSMWTSIVTEAKSKVAETLDEFRGNFIYNLMDENVRAFNAQVPVIYQWDDHEVVNNWYPSEIIEDERYQIVQSVSLLAARGNRAFMEYNPIRSNGQDPERIFRTIHYGPLLDVFVIDMRSYRGPNGTNLQEEPGPETAFLGREQIRWLKQELLRSTATWKVIASDMPIGLIVTEFPIMDQFENVANGDGPPLGREFEMANLLRFIKDSDIRNVVWLTADVHYTAAHYYDPNEAQFTEFKPFYEFVSGPLNAGTFGPNALDNTFGPQVLFQKVPEEGTFNLPPSAGLQFFGQVLIDGQSEVMTVHLRDLNGDILYTQEIEPEV